MLITITDVVIGNNGCDSVIGHTGNKNIQIAVDSNLNISRYIGQCIEYDFKQRMFNLKEK